MSMQPTGLSPLLFFETANAYQRTAALKAAIELDLFTAIAEGARTPQTLAEKRGAAERGMRILCDYLVIIGFLTKEEEGYGLTPDSALFLDRRSPAYVGGATEFLLSPMLLEEFADLAGVVRKGGTLSEAGTVAPDHPVWVKFARAMAPMMAIPAQMLAAIVDSEPERKLRVLDIAAGHGLYGIALAARNPHVEVVALDWPHVLEVAQENARAAGVGDRYSLLPGSAFDLAYGEDYDVVLLTNFLHHFDTATCENLLRKVHAALAPQGRAVTLEFIPNEDRVSPPPVAAFSLTMLASTPGGDAYTFAEFERMLQHAGFTRSELHSLEPVLQQAIVSNK